MFTLGPEVILSTKAHKNFGLHNGFLTQFEPPHDKTNKVTVRPAKTDQPRHPPSLIRVLAVHTKKAWILSYPWVHSEDSDQTGRMPRLIWVFAGRTCHFVGFVTRRLIYGSHWIHKNQLYHHDETKRSTLDKADKHCQPVPAVLIYTSQKF